MRATSRRTLAARSRNYLPKKLFTKDRSNQSEHEKKGLQMEGERGGGCECGAVRYLVSGKPLAVVVCHCKSCQRQSGSAFGMSMLFAPDQFVCESNELSSYQRTADSGATMHRHFCRTCGTTIFTRKPNASYVILKPGTLDDTSEVRPTIQLWTRRKQSWLQLPQLQGFEEQPP